MSSAAIAVCLKPFVIIIIAEIIKRIEQR